VGDSVERQMYVNRFFNNRARDAERLEILKHYGVTHVLIRWAPRGSLAEFLAKHGQAQSLGGRSELRLYIVNPATAAP